MFEENVDIKKVHKTQAAQDAAQREMQALRAEIANTAQQHREEISTLQKEKAVLKSQVNEISAMKTQLTNTLLKMKLAEALARNSAVKHTSAECKFIESDVGAASGEDERESVKAAVQLEPLVSGNDQAEPSSEFSEIKEKENDAMEKTSDRDTDDVVSRKDSLTTLQVTEQRGSFRRPNSGLKTSPIRKQISIS
jgi:ATP/maltotriose-dependent transcriptional regulator MalT